MQKRTEFGAVPMPCLVWYIYFTFLKLKKDGAQILYDGSSSPS